MEYSYYFSKFAKNLPILQGNARELTISFCFLIFCAKHIFKAKECSNKLFSQYFRMSTVSWRHSIHNRVHVGQTGWRTGNHRAMEPVRLGKTTASALRKIRLRRLPSTSLAERNIYTNIRKETHYHVHSLSVCGV